MHAPGYPICIHAVHALISARTLSLARVILIDWLRCNPALMNANRAYGAITDVLESPGCAAYASIHSLVLANLYDMGTTRCLPCLMQFPVQIANEWR